jgi:hypothetical protein
LRRARPDRSACRARAWLALACVGLACAGAAHPSAAAEPAQGTYCPFPKPGETPQCIGEVRSQYGEFFEGLADGHLTDAEAARLERDVEAGGSGAFDAVSGLAYGYYLLAERLASGGADPDATARLERWNALLARAWAGAPEGSGYRAALREAASDLHTRAPRVRLACRDAEGRATECGSTEEVLRLMDDVREETGVRGVLARLFRRLGGGER